MTPALVSIRNCEAVLGMTWGRVKRLAKLHGVPGHKIGTGLHYDRERILAAAGARPAVPTDHADVRALAEAAARKHLRKVG